jgi:biopolymer transport protein ExbD
MAKRQKSSGGQDTEVDMTPMIDVVFQLLAFFMVITNFEQTQADERVKLPRDVLAKPPEVQVEHKLVLNVGYIRKLNGERKDPDPWLFNFADADKIRPLQSAEALNRESRIYAQKGIEPSEVTIKIRADAEVPTGIIQEMIKICQDAGFEKFAMSAMSGAEE